MQRHLQLHVGVVMLLLCGFAGVLCWTPAGAQTTTPAAAQKPAPFAYAAPALIQELDAKYPFPPPIPPSPPRAGGVVGDRRHHVSRHLVPVDAADWLRPHLG
jgi:hypothetical protein